MASTFRSSRPASSSACNARRSCSAIGVVFGIRACTGSEIPAIIALRIGNTIPVLSLFGTPLGRVPVFRALQAKMFAKCMAGVIGPKQSAPLQLREDHIDEVVEAARQ